MWGYVIKSRGGQVYDSDCHALDAEGGEGAHLFIVWVEQDREVLISQGPVEQPGAGCGLGFLCLRYTCSLSHTAAKSVVERWEGRCKASWKRGSMCSSPQRATARVPQRAPLHMSCSTGCKAMMLSTPLSLSLSLYPSLTLSLSRTLTLHRG